MFNLKYYKAVKYKRLLKKEDIIFFHEYVYDVSSAQVMSTQNLKSSSFITNSFNNLLFKAILKDSIFNCCKNYATGLNALTYPQISSNRVGTKSFKALHKQYNIVGVIFENKVYLRSQVNSIKSFNYVTNFKNLLNCNVYLIKIFSKALTLKSE